MLYGAGSSSPVSAIELITARLDITVTTPARYSPKPADGSGRRVDALRTTRPVYWREEGGYVETPVYVGDLLEPGDAIIVTTENGLKLTFNVIELQSYPLDTFPAEYVYGDYEGTALRLITCDGVWNSIKKSYSERLVVVSELVKEGVLN